jgi:hypothetical protein
VKGDKRMKSRKINYFKYFSLFFILIALALIIGCSGTPGAVPIINSLSAIPLTITVGESSTLSWSVTDATSVTIDNGVGTVALSGTTTVSPTTTTTYILTATNTAGSVTATTTVTVSSYVLGDIGPAGGYIFYDKGYYSKADFTIVKAAGNGTVPITPPYDAWRYLEAAPSDNPNAVWGCKGTSIFGAGGTAVGAGEQNTIDIEAGCTTPDTAADLCANLSLGGYSDWFLPSKDELNLMYENLKLFGVGGFAGIAYWSSSEFTSEFSADFAWAQNFTDGNQGYTLKNSTVLVRAVRAF